MTTHSLVFETSDAFDISLKVSPACSTFYAENVYKASFET
jgi:hypothetical protein